MAARQKQKSKRLLVDNTQSAWHNMCTYVLIYVRTSGYKVGHKHPTKAGHKSSGVESKLPSNKNTALCFDRNISERPAAFDLL